MKGLRAVFIAGCLGCLLLSGLSAKQLPEVSVIATGGGIAGVFEKVQTKSRFSVARLSVDSLLEEIPAINSVAKISAEQFSNIPSQSMTDELLLKLARRVNTVLSSNMTNGVVITHGTDTMEETAYFLNLVLNTRKPVVVVGAVRPANHHSPDGPSNLYDAISVAADTKSEAKGALIVMNGRIFSSRGATKAHTYATDAFQPTDAGFLGYVNQGEVSYYQSSSRRHTYRSEFAIDQLKTLPKVEIVYAYGNANRDLIDAAIRSGAKGIVVAGVGNGNIHPEMLKALQLARSKGIQIVRSSRTGSGLVSKGLEVDDAAYQFVTADNLNPQKARILLKCALTKTGSTPLIQKIFDAY